MNNTLIIFDIDGTLTDSIKVYEGCYTVALTQLNLKKAKEFGTFKNHTDRYIFKEIYFGNHGKFPAPDEIRGFYQLLTGVYDLATQNSGISEIAGARAFIKNQLDLNGIPYVFATGSISAPAIKKLEKFDIESLRSLLASSDQLDTREEIVLDAVEKACSYYNRKDFPTKIIIGDGKWDYITAVNLNMGFLGIGDNPSLKKEMGNNTSCVWADFNNRTYDDLLRNVLFF